MSPADQPASETDARLTAAAEWLITLREKPTEPQVIAAWLQWRQEHPDNPRVFSEIEEIWALTGGAETALALAHPADSPQSGTVGAVPAATHRSARRRGWTRWSIAAGLAASLIAIMLLWRAGYLVQGEAPVEYATAQATQRELRLSDGSTLLLGGDSVVRVTYSEVRRHIQLLRGEAHFAVQHDTQRPFVVLAHGIAVTAVGTAFNVRADGTRTVVSVSEGIVEVGPGTPTEKDQPALQSTLRARAGQQVVVDAALNMQSTLTIQLSDTLAPNDWQEGVLSFVDEPLRTVIARVNRYSRHNIAIADASLEELRFTGTVFRERIEDWALGLEKAFPIKANTDVHGDIRLERYR